MQLQIGLNSMDYNGLSTKKYAGVSTDIST
jgi:hypothetical protein